MPRRLLLPVLALALTAALISSHRSRPDRAGSASVHRLALIADRRLSAMFHPPHALNIPVPFPNAGSCEATGSCTTKACARFVTASGPYSTGRACTGRPKAAHALPVVGQAVEVQGR